MSVAIIDLSNYRDKSSARVPEGKYLVQIEEVEDGKSSKGNTMYTVYMRIVGGKYDGLNLVDRLPQTENAMFRTVAFLNALGIKTPRKKIKIKLSALAGKKVMVNVVDGEPYNGRVRSEIDSFERADISAESVDEDDDLEDFDDIEEVEEAPVKKAKPAKKAQPVEDDDDDDDDDDDEQDSLSDDPDIDLDDLDV